METNNLENRNYILAQQRVEQLKKFYKHLATYLIINIFLSSLFIFSDMNDGASFTEALFQKSTFIIWFFWGIGLAFDAIKTFGFGKVFSKDWENRKIKEYLNQEK